MQTDYTHILYILDRSGSMGTVQNDVRHGFDSFIADQKKQPGKCTFSLVQFSDYYEKFYDFIDIQSIKPIEFSPSGFTALLDAIGKGMTETGAKLASLPEEDRPAKVLVLIHTDGEENASREYTKSQIGEMIKHQEEKYQWKVAFIGTQFDVIGEASSLGVSIYNTLQYNNTSDGISAVYSVVSSSVSACRSATIDSFNSTAGIFKPEEQRYVETTN